MDYSFHDSFTRSIILQQNEMKQERKNILGKIKIQFVAYNGDFHLISRNNGNE